MEKELIFSLISTGIYLFGAIPFWRDIVSRRTIPHAFTYIAWLILVGINVMILWGNHEWYALIPNGVMLGSLIFATIFSIISIRKISLNWFDYLCFFLSISLLLYWFLSKNNLHTVILTACVDCIAFLPTFKKGWMTPWTESIFIYFMTAIGQIFTLFSLSSFGNGENMIFWSYLFFANLAFFFMVSFRRVSLRGWKSIFD